jgi:hypothetical protein
MLLNDDCLHDPQTQGAPLQLIDGYRHHPNLYLQAAHRVNGWHLKNLKAHILVVLVLHFQGFHVSLLQLFQAKDYYQVEFEFLVQAPNSIIAVIEWLVAVVA